ncbi:hypothetical protein KUCAC02_024553, partial [Chaenocephalus aceratus]
TLHLDHHPHTVRRPGRCRMIGTVHTGSNSIAISLKLLKAQSPSLSSDLFPDALGSIPPTSAHYR